MISKYELRSHISTAFTTVMVPVTMLLAAIMMVNPLYGQQVQWTNYTAGERVYGVAQTQTYTWAATTGGLARINKSSGDQQLLTHANSGLPANNLTAIAVDNNGTVWIGTLNAGIASYEGNQWQHFSPDNSNLDGERINDLAVGPDNTIWATTENGVFRYDGNRWDIFQTQLFSQPPNFHAIAASGTGQIWVGLENEGLASFQTSDPTSWTMWQNHSSTPLDFSSVRSVGVNTDGRIWVGSELGELAVRDGSAWTVYESGSTNLPNANILSLEFSGPDSVWIGSESSGLTIYDGSAWTTYTSGNSGLNTNSVWGLSVDPDGRRFLGTVSGLVEFNNGNMSSFDLANSSLQQTSKTTDIAFDSQGNVWIGNGDDFDEDGYGLVKYDGSSWSVLTTSNSDLPGNTVLAVEVGPDDRVWTGTTDGLGIYDGSSWEVFSGFQSPLPENVVQDIAVTSAGIGWIVTSDFDGGVARYDGSDWNTWTASGSGIPTEDLTSVAVDCTGTVWIGTRYNGVVKYDGSSWTSGNGTNTYLQSTTVTDLAVDHDNNLWISTRFSNDVRGGIVKYDGENWTNHLARNSTFPFDAGGANAVAVDAAGNVWIGSEDAGLVQYDGEKMQIYQRGNSGISSNTLFGVSVDASGRKWIGNAGGGIDVMEGGASPVANFAALTREGQAPFTVKFRDKSGNNPSTYSWDLPGGDPGTSSEQNPSVTYSSAGTYEVTLEVTNAYGSDEQTKSGFITVGGSDYTPSTAWQVYTNGDVVHEILEEGDSLWVATSGGLVLLNTQTGSRTIYNTSNSALEANNISDVDMDGAGTKWIGTDGGGLVSLNNGNWSVYNAGNSDFEYNSVTQVEVDDEGVVWFATVQTGGFLGGGSNEGIISYDGSTFEHHSFSENSDGDQLPDGRIDVLTFDGSGDLWIGTGQAGLVKYDRTDFTVYNSSNSELLVNDIDAITSAGDELIWVGGGGIGAGLYRFDGSSWEVYTENNSEILDDWVQTIAIDDQGNKWIGTQARGMAMFDGSTFQSYRHGNSGVLSDNVNQIHIDSEGTFWVGTKIQPSIVEFTGTAGLSSWDQGTWERHDISNSGLPNNSVAAVFQDSRGDIWSSSQSAIGLLGEPLRGGIVRYDGADWELYMEGKTGIPSNTVEKIVEDGDGNLWMANPSGDAGAIRYNNSVWTNYTPENSDMPSSTVNDYAIDGNGDVWMATSAGLVRYTNSVETVYTTSNSDIPGDQVTSVGSDGNGTIWVGTTQSGVAAFDYNADSWTIYDDTDNEELMNNITQILVRSSSEVYLVSSGFLSSSLVHFSNGSWSTIEATALINDMALDSQGQLWAAFGSTTDFPGGIGKFDGSAWTYYSSDNSQYPDGPVRDLEITAQGDIWLASNEGIVVFKGEDAVTDIEEPEERKSMPEQYALSQNYPNPFNPVTKISYTLPEDSRVQLQIYNVLGQRVDVLVDEYQSAGQYTIRWDAAGLSSGVYFYRLATPEFTKVHKMTYLK